MQDVINLPSSRIIDTLTQTEGAAIYRRPFKSVTDIGPVHVNSRKILATRAIAETLLLAAAVPLLRVIGDIHIGVE